MKHLKTYEDINDEPKKGDYCVCGYDILGRDNKRGNYKNQIGVIRIATEGGKYMVEFENGVLTWFVRDEILFFSPRKQDVELYMNKDIKNYNL